MLESDAVLSECLLPFSCPEETTAMLGAVC